MWTKCDFGISVDRDKFEEVLDILHDGCTVCPKEYEESGVCPAFDHPEGSFTCRQCWSGYLNAE